MNQKIAFFGMMVVALMLSGAGTSAPLTAVRGHALTLDVKISGQQVMTPMVELAANAPAIIEVEGPKPNQRYSLHLLLKDQQVVGKLKDVVSLEAQLFSGDTQSQKLLANPTLFIRPGQGGSATINSANGEIEIAVLTHAIREHKTSEL